MLLHWSPKQFKHLQIDKAHDVTDCKETYAFNSTNKHKFFKKKPSKKEQRFTTSPEQAAQRGCGFPVPRSAKGQVGQAPGQPGLVLNGEVAGPACGWGVGDS